MSHCGMNCLADQAEMAFEFEIYGSLMCLTKAKVGCSMKTGRVMTVSTQLPAIQRHIANDAASWFDHPRDLLHMINLFRTQMPRPLVGIGHSMGGCQL